MFVYDKDTDYCGPAGRIVSKCISREVAGVDTNKCCFNHDIAYIVGLKRKDADVAFWLCMKQRIVYETSWNSPRRYWALLVARFRYRLVRLFGEDIYNA